MQLSILYLYISITMQIFKSDFSTSAAPTHTKHMVLFLSILFWTFVYYLPDFITALCLNASVDFSSSAYL